MGSSDHLPQGWAVVPQACAGMARMGYVGKSRVKEAGRRLTCAFLLCLEAEYELKHSYLVSAWAAFQACWAWAGSVLMPGFSFQLGLKPAWSLWTCLDISGLPFDLSHHPYPSPALLHRYHGAASLAESLPCSHSQDLFPCPWELLNVCTGAHRKDKK